METKIGEVNVKDKDETELIFSAPPGLKGTAVIRKVRDKPRLAKGVLNKDDGSTWQLAIEVKDR